MHTLDILCAKIHIVMSFFKNTESCKKVGTAAPRDRHVPLDLRASRNRNKSMFADDFEKNMAAQLLLAAEIEHFSCGIRPAPPAAPGAPRRPSPLSYRKSNISVFFKKDITIYSVVVGFWNVRISYRQPR